MAKVLNVVFGIGIGVVIYTLMLLGIQAFHPEPKYNEFCNESMMYSDSCSSFAKCTDEMTVKECRASMEVNDKEWQKCQQDLEKANMAYSKDFFIIANILGVLTVIAAFFLLNITNVSAGVACAGILLIMWAFLRGWISTDNKLKFIVGLIIAAIVISLAVIVNKKLTKKKIKKN